VEDFGDQARPEDTGARLRAVRELAGLSSRDVARAAGISKRELAAVERGRHRLTQDELRSLAGALGVHPDVLVSGRFGELDRTATEGERVHAVVGHDPAEWHSMPDSPADLPAALPVNLPNPERRRDLSTRKEIEDSWNDVRSQMDPVIRQCMRVTTIGSGDDVREMIDTLEIEIRRLKVSQSFIRGVARHEQTIASARGRSNSSKPPLHSSRTR
jgi:transcriptional regulator with XRE-family HTH domain